MNLSLLIRPDLAAGAPNMATRWTNGLTQTTAAPPPPAPAVPASSQPPSQPSQLPPQPQPTTTRQMVGRQLFILPIPIPSGGGGGGDDDTGSRKPPRFAGRQVYASDYPDSKAVYAAADSSSQQLPPQVSYKSEPTYSYQPLMQQPSSDQQEMPVDRVST